MKDRRLAWILGLMIWTLGAIPASSSQEGMLATGLRCEYRIDPLGIDTLQPRLSWVLESGERGQKQTAYRVLVADSREKLDQDQGNLWDSARVESAESLHRVYLGIPLTSRQRCFWKVRVWDRARQPSVWSKPAYWETGLLFPEDWKGIWISDGKPLPEKDEDFYAEDPAPLFRKAFDVEKKITRARLYITGLGYYEARLNGRRIGDHVLDPGWSDYRDRIFYSTYDVSGLLLEGENALGVMLGNGWYNPLPLRMWGRLNLREHLPVGRPCLIAQLEIEFVDGSFLCLGSDTTWKVQNGPIRRNNIYLGEVYDARHEIPGWDVPGFEDDLWSQAAPAASPGGRLQAQPQPPVRILEEIPAVAITRPRADAVIYDLGENFSGCIRLYINAPPGTKILIRYGELLHPDGSLNPMTGVAGQIKGVRKDGTRIGGPGAPEIAEQQDVYVARGTGDEVFSSIFAFHAFRYAEVTGHPGSLELKDLTGLRLHADVASAGSFACSDPYFNRIQEMTRRTFLSNIFSVQSDCPHRERFGYGGDLAVTNDAFMLNFDMAAFYAKTVQDWQDAVRPDGMLTDTAPFVGIHYCGVAWALIHPLLQSQLYRYYGDRRLIEEQYPVSRKWLDLVAAQNPTYIISEGLSDHEGLEPAPAPKLVTPLYVESARLLSRLAGLLGQEQDRQRYDRLAGEIQKAYLADFLEPGTGRIQPVSQAGQAFALALDILPLQEREAALRVLLQKLKQQDDGHLTTGIYGTRYLLDVLARTGHMETAAQIVRKKGFPGWDYMLENGATTLWEHWALSDNTFSHNHPMFGSISEWFFKWMAGIQPHPQAFGFDRIVIRPQLVSEVDWAEAQYHSVRGKIAVRWDRMPGMCRLSVDIPANTSAEIFVPCPDQASVREGDEPAASVPGIRCLGLKNGCSVYQVGSGSYLFSFPDSSGEKHDAH